MELLPHSTENRKAKRPSTKHPIDITIPQKQEKDTSPEDITGFLHYIPAQSSLQHSPNHTKGIEDALSSTFMGNRFPSTPAVGWGL